MLAFFRGIKMKEFIMDLLSHWIEVRRVRAINRVNAAIDNADIEILSKYPYTFVMDVLELRP